jgi:hypothetical protein
MNYIINPAWFYWLQLVNGAKVVFGIFLGVAVVLLIVLSAVYITNVDCCGADDEDTQRYAKMVKKCVILCVTFAIVMVVIPSKDTLIEMQIAKYATYENANWTLDAIKSAVDYIIEAINSMK